MNLIQHISEFPTHAHNCAVTIGNFDGVHRGHIHLMERLVASAKQVGGPSVVFTFNPHPAKILRPELCPAPLTWLERKAALLGKLGIDWLVAYPTDEAILSLSAANFFEQIIQKTLGAKAMVEGPNFFFGKGREGNVQLLSKMANNAKIALEIVEPCDFNQEIISSSRIRKLITEGDVATAKTLLLEPHRIRGTVTKGAGRGASLGFPTANLEKIDTLVPPHGVYAGEGSINGKKLPAAIHIGPNPTFSEDISKVEVHLVGHDQPIYDQILEVDFLERLRDIHPFASVDLLLEQINKDVVRVKEITS